MTLRFPTPVRTGSGSTGASQRLDLERRAPSEITAVIIAEQEGKNYPSLLEVASFDFGKSQPTGRMSLIWWELAENQGSGSDLL